MTLPAMVDVEDTESHHHSPVDTRHRRENDVFSVAAVVGRDSAVAMAYSHARPPLQYLPPGRSSAVAAFVHVFVVIRTMQLPIGVVAIQPVQRLLNYGGQ